MECVVNLTPHELTIVLSIISALGAATVAGTALQCYKPRFEVVGICVCGFSGAMVAALAINLLSRL